MPSEKPSQTVEMTHQILLIGEIGLFIEASFSAQEGKFCRAVKIYLTLIIESELHVFQGVLVLRITSLSDPSVTSGLARSASSGGSARFAVGGESSAAKAPSKTIATIGLSAVLALQDEGETPGERRRRQLRRGVGILDALDALKRDMVLGRLGEASFSRLSSALSLVSPADLDPGARQILRDIDVRAAVELAKAGR